MITLLAGAAALLSIAMTAAWAVQRRTGQSGWIDAIWSLSVGATGAIALSLHDEWTLRRAMVLALVCLWSLRLGLHIAARTKGAGDDPRYAALMAEWGAAGPRRLFGFLQAQAAAGLVLVACLVLAATGPARPSLLGLAAAALALVALAGEAIADAQLGRWKRRRIVNGICDIGLWSRSRHPNYFFEWLFWLAVALIALDGAAAATPLALAAPAMMYYLLRHASGVPHVEAHMRRTRPAAFEAYAARVPVFFPRLGG